MHELEHVIEHAILITGFVLVMMLVIEYMNVRSQGTLQRRLVKNRWGQYVIAAFLGAIPGCLGAFTVVGLYTHRVISFGALVAAMLATAGDGSFVMFAMIPREAFYLHVALFGIGILGGALTDSFVGHRLDRQNPLCPDLVVHEAVCKDLELLPKGQIIHQWRHCSVSRGVLATALVLLLVGVLIGGIGPDVWNWVRISILAVTAIAIIIVVTVSDHFLEEHLWRHVVLRHVPRIFLWTLGALTAIHLLVAHFDISNILQRGQWAVLFGGGMIGVIPDSGPHLMFVTLYAQDLIPMSILLANSIVQDGHGMLPLLAHSRRAFFLVKGINLGLGLIIGAVWLLLGR